jgi:hypothetical protein
MPSIPARVSGGSAPRTSDAAASTGSDTPSSLAQSSQRSHSSLDARPPSRGGLPPRSNPSALKKLLCCTAPPTPEPQTPGVARFDNLQPMRAKYEGEEVRRVFGQSVTHLTPTQRQAFKVTIKNGLMLDARGKPFSSEKPGLFGKSNTDALFVMDATGDIYAARVDKNSSKFHHSSFLAGAPVAAAGELHVKDGEVLGVTNRTGHYLTNKEQIDGFVDELYGRGAADMAVQYVRGNN